MDNLWKFTLLLLLSSAATLGQSPLGFSCFVSGTTAPLRSEGQAELLGDVLLTCSGGTPTPVGMPVPSANITIAINTQFASRILSSPNVTEALLLVNEPSPANQLLCSSSSGCQTVADGNGGGQSSEGSDYNGTVGHPNIFSGVRNGTNVISFVGVPVDPPGSVPFGSAAPILKLRITNLRANASAFVTLSNVDVTGFILSFYGQITNSTVVLGNVSPGLNGNPPLPAAPAVSQAASFPQCASQSLQRAFLVSATEGFASAFKPRFSSTISSESMPGVSPLAESGFLVNGAPLTVSSPGVADSATRIKLQFGSPQPGVSLYVPLVIGSGQYLPAGNPVQSLTAVLTSTESGPFSAVPASPGTGGSLALVTGGAAIYEVVDTQPGSATTVETLTAPVYISYSASSPATFPTLGTATVSVSLAPIFTANSPSGNIPTFFDPSTPQFTFTISPCGVATFTARGGAQSTIVNTPFNAPLQTLLLSANGNPVPNYSITYTLPASGPGALFSGGGNVVTVTSNAQGIATSPAIVANGSAGTFTATATTGSLNVSFSLTNLPAPVILTQTIRFPPIPDHNSSDAPFTVSAVSSSGLPVQFAVLSGPATVAGNLVTLTGTGLVSIQATQPGNDTYAAAAPANINFRVFGPGPSVMSLQNGGYTSSVLAPDSFGEIFGANLGSQMLSAPSLPFPAQMGGLTLILTDAGGRATPLLLSYVSPTQINFLVPAGVASGAATLVITNGNARTTSVPVTVATVSPSLFSVDGTGKGTAAGQVTKTGDVFLFALYGTGFRNAKSVTVTVNGTPAQVVYRGPQGQFPGVDQLNISSSSAGDILLTADGIAANVVTLKQP